MKRLTIAIFLLSLNAQSAPKRFDKSSFEKALSEIRSKAYYQLTDDEIYQAALTGVLDKIEQKSKNENASLPIAKANVILQPNTINSLSNH